MMDMIKQYMVMCRNYNIHIYHKVEILFILLNSYVYLLKVVHLKGHLSSKRDNISLRMQLPQKDTNHVKGVCRKLYIYKPRIKFKIFIFSLSL